METFNKIRNTGVPFCELIGSGRDGLWKTSCRTEIPVFRRMFDFGRVETGEEEVIEEIAVCDEQPMEEYLEKGSVAAASIRRLVAERKIFPCYIGSALHLQGVEELMNGICTYQMLKEYPAAFGAKVF